ncbi:MAG TPA: hypothetical protein VEO19_16915 [Terriglobia bacterium]|nr:hypothetical protein [Terriglobia bacterium]
MRPSRTAQSTAPNVRLEKAVQSKPPLIFDNSAVNRLADDPEQAPLLAGMQTGFWFRLSGDSVDEIVATTDKARRRLLLDLCKLLLTSGECLLPHAELIEGVTKQHATATAFKWDAVGVRCRDLEDEIVRQEFINDHIAAEQRRLSAVVGNEFAQIHERARPHFQKLFRRHGAPPPSLNGLVEALQVPRGAFWSMASDLYSEPTGVNINEAAARDFVDACPPFRSLLMALCVAQHQRSVQNPRQKSTGVVDLFASVYLPYCDEFVTADRMQQEALLQVASLAKLAAKVRSYADFRAALLLRGSGA